jgi:hypothetical protein
MGRQPKRPVRMSCARRHLRLSGVSMRGTVIGFNAEIERYGTM